jgi:hypothetical protein
MNATKTLSMTPAAVKARAKRAAAKAEVITANTIPADVTEVNGTPLPAVNQLRSHFPSYVVDMFNAAFTPAQVETLYTNWWACAQQDFKFGESTKAQILKEARIVLATVEAEQAAPAAANPFAQLVSAVDPDAAPAAAAKAQAAIKPAASKKAAPARANPTDDPLTYALTGAYKGKAGAMFAFVERLTKLRTFTRANVVASVEAAPVHALIKDRTAALDYFGWALRHNLVAVHAADPKSAFMAVKTAERNRKAARKAAKAAA